MPRPNAARRSPVKQHTNAKRPREPKHPEAVRVPAHPRAPAYGADASVVGCTMSRTCWYTAASSCSEECEMQAVCVLMAPLNNALECGLITSSQSLHHVA